MHRMTRLSFALVVAVVCSPCYGHDAASVEKIWRERQERIKEIHLKWTEQVTHFKLPGPTTGGGEYARSVEGRSLRICDSYNDRSVSGPPSTKQPHKGSGTVRKQRHSIAYDGVTIAGLFDPLDEKDYPKGDVTIGLEPGTAIREPLDARFQAAQLFCRPLDKAFGLPEGLGGLTAHEVELEGEKCLQFDKGLASYWVTSDERALLLRRQDKRHDTGSPYLDLRVRYSKDATSGEWLPSGWDYKLLGTDGVFVGESRVAKVTMASVHTPLPVELFRLQFPEGAWIAEFEGGTMQREYIHRSKKGPRFLSPGELNDKNYRKLLNGP